MIVKQKPFTNKFGDRIEDSLISVKEFDPRVHIKLEPGDVGYQATEKEKLRAEILAEQEAECPGEGCGGCEGCRAKPDTSAETESPQEPRELSDKEEKELFTQMKAERAWLQPDLKEEYSRLKGLYG